MRRRSSVVWLFMLVLVSASLSASSFARKPKGMVYGNVTELKSGKPVHGARIIIQFEHGKKYDHIYTQGGFFSRLVNDTGRVWITCEKRGFDPVQIDTSYTNYRAALRLEIKLDKHPELRLRPAPDRMYPWLMDDVEGLEGAAEVHGLVRDESTGEPVCEAVVFLLNTQRRCETDSLGRYVIRNLPPNTYDMGVARRGYAEVALGAIKMEPDKVQVVNFELEPVDSDRDRYWDAVPRLYPKPRVKLDPSWQQFVRSSLDSLECAPMDSIRAAMQ